MAKTGKSSAMSSGTSPDYWKKGTASAVGTGVKAAQATQQIANLPTINYASIVNPSLTSSLAGTVKTPVATTPAATSATTAATSATPYLDIAKAYEQKARENLATQESALAKQLEESKKGTNASYDSAAAGNYINYMKQQNALPEQLARQGIRGGASESALTRIGNNYALAQGSNSASRAAALGQLQSAYDTNVANMRQSLEDSILNNNMALQQSQVQYDDTLAQRAAEDARYREEVERAQRERAEDIARDDARYADEQKWKEKEWKQSQTDQKVEQYAAGLTRFVGTSGIKKLQNIIKNLTKKKGWSSDPLTRGKVRAAQARIGAIRAGK